MVKFNNGSTLSAVTHFTEQTCLRYFEINRHDKISVLIITVTATKCSKTFPSQSR